MIYRTCLIFRTLRIIVLISVNIWNIPIEFCLMRYVEFLLNQTTMAKPFFASSECIFPCRAQENFLPAENINQYAYKFQFRRSRAMKPNSSDFLCHNRNF